jgi:hypothetical protein
MLDVPFFAGKRAPTGRPWPTLCPSLIDVGGIAGNFANNRQLGPGYKAQTQKSFATIIAKLFYNA